jgi:hypothetical protein
MLLILAIGIGIVARCRSLGTNDERSKAADRKHEFLNPDHVRSVREIQGGTQIIFSDGAGDDFRN